MNHKISWDYIMFWSSIFTLLVLSHKANGILTDSNDIQCTHIQCPTKCPADSYLKSSLDDEEEDFEDYGDELLGHDPYIEEVGHFEVLPPEEELHYPHSFQHALKERQKRDVFFQEDIERCCDDQKCVCSKCEDVPKCAEGHVAVQIHEGQGVPGNCCSIFRCMPKVKCQLGVKQSWWTGKCTTCNCLGENEFCMQICPEEEILQNCYSEYLQKPMMNGAFWKEGSCTSCSCEQGERRCLTPVCPKLDCKETIKIEDECCPKCTTDEIDERPEIIHDNKEKGIEDIEEEYFTESTTIDTPLIIVNEEHNSSIFKDYSGFPVVDENLLNESQTTSPTTVAEDSSTASSMPKIVEDVSATFKPEINELFEGNVSKIQSTTATAMLDTVVNSTLPTIVPEERNSVQHTEFDLLPHLNTITTTEEQVKYDSSTEVPKSKAAFEDLYSTIKTKEGEDTLENETSTIPLDIQTTTEVLIAEETTILDNAITNDGNEISGLTSTTHVKESSTTEANILSSTVSASPQDLQTTIVSSENNSVFIKIEPNETTTNFSIIFLTSVATESTISTQSTTSTPEISSSSATSSSKNTPTDDSSIETSTISTTSTDYPVSPSTSTTSSPFPLTSDSQPSTAIPILDEFSTSSSTTAPEPVKPLFQPYGDLNSEGHTPSNQNQMRIMFDEIDYVVMIVLFTGSVLCISLGLIIRHTKNRKKMYSSIPNSETSLSQTSTNTVLTV